MTLRCSWEKRKVTFDNPDLVFGIFKVVKVKKLNPYTVICVYMVMFIACNFSTSRLCLVSVSFSSFLIVVYLINFKISKNYFSRVWNGKTGPRVYSICKWCSYFRPKGFGGNLFLRIQEKVRNLHLMSFHTKLCAPVVTYCQHIR